jgi:hypothetical protein
MATGLRVATIPISVLFAVTQQAQPQEQTDREQGQQSWHPGRVRRIDKVGGGNCADARARMAGRATINEPPPESVWKLPIRLMIEVSLAVHLTLSGTWSPSTITATIISSTLWVLKHILHCAMIIGQDTFFQTYNSYLPLFRACIVCWRANRAEMRSLVGILMFEVLLQSSSAPGTKKCTKHIRVDGSTMWSWIDMLSRPDEGQRGEFKACYCQWDWSKN